MNDIPNWSAFYKTLEKLGPKMLDGDGLEHLIGFIRLESSESEAFWSSSLQTAIENGWNDNPREAVIAALTVWVENVRGYLKEILGPSTLIPWESPMLGMQANERVKLRKAARKISLRLDEDLVDQLVVAAGHCDEDSLKNQTEKPATDVR